MFPNLLMLLCKLPFQGFPSLSNPPCGYSVQMSSKKENVQTICAEKTADQKVGKRLKYRNGFASTFCGAGIRSGLLMLHSSALSLLDQLLTEQPKTAKHRDWVISAEDN